MDKKENDIDSEDMKVGSEDPSIDLVTIRETMGLTLRDISSSTRVSFANLKAIEEQQFEKLPEPIYARAFILAYTNTLDINGHELLSRYEQYLLGLQSNDQNETLERLKGKGHNLRFWIGLVIVLSAIVFTGIFYFNQWSKMIDQRIDSSVPVTEAEIVENTRDLSETEQTRISADEVDKTLGTQGSNLSEPVDISGPDHTKDTVQAIKEKVLPKTIDKKSEPNAVPDKTIAADENPYKLTISASEITWIHIKKDEEPPFEVTLRAGEKIAEKAWHKFDLVVGNAGGVNISFQGKALGVIGEHGEVVHLILPADM